MKKFLFLSNKSFAKALTVVPIFLLVLIPSFNAEGKKRTSNKPASSEEVFLYRQIGINFLCRARLSEIEFPKALGISSATFADIIDRKHDGRVQELPDKKLTPKQLYFSAELQIIEGAIRFCPDQVPEETKTKFNELIDKADKDKKSNKGR